MFPLLSQQPSALMMSPKEKDVSYTGVLAEEKMQFAAFAGTFLVRINLEAPEGV